MEEKLPFRQKIRLITGVFPMPHSLILTSIDCAIPVIYFLFVLGTGHVPKRSVSGSKDLNKLLPHYGSR